MATKRFISAIVCAIVASSCGTAAQAEVIGYDVNTAGGAYTGAGVLDTNSRTWESGGSFSLDGNAITVTVAPVFSGSIGSPAISLFENYQHNNAAGAVTFTLDGLDDSLTYDLAIYGAQDGFGGRGGQFDVTTPAGGGSGGTTGNDFGSFVLDSNYVLFSGLAPQAGQIEFDLTNGVDGIGIINGFEIQITDVPEPSSLAIFALLGLVGVGYGWMKRRKSK